MIWMNQVAGVQGISPWWKHMPAGADAMSFVDAVFPAFLCIVGMSMPFAFDARRARGEAIAQIARHVLRRTIGLCVFGLYMVNAEMGGNPQHMPLSIQA